MATTDIGMTLRRAREAGGLTIGDVAARTKIVVQTLQAIEREAFDRLPGGIFRREYVRLFAEAVGLDGRALARAYVDRFEPPPPPAPPPPPRPQVDERQIGAIVALMLLGLVLFAAHGARPTSGPPAAQDAADAGALPAVPAAEPMAAGAASVAAAVAPAELRLQLATTGACWISATADDVRVVHRLVEAGETIDVAALRSIVVRLGDPGVVSYAYNGAPPRPAGSRGQPVTLAFTAGGLLPSAAEPLAEEI